LWVPMCTNLSMDIADERAAQGVRRSRIAARATYTRRGLWGSVEYSRGIPLWVPWNDTSPGWGMSVIER
jgi:hypothetical protein